MDKLEYIPGDLVKFATNTYTINNFGENFLQSKIYALISTNSTKTAFVEDIDILPIPLTPEILEKNGWKKSIGWSCVGSKEHGYKFSKELDDKWDELNRMTYGDLQICQCKNLRDWNYINECNHYFNFEFTYVHELQHLLFGLGLNSEMEV